MQCSYLYFIPESLALAGFPGLIHYPQKWTPDVKKLKFKAKKLEIAAFEPFV